jgi:signal transduction histidine kinase
MLLSADTAPVDHSGSARAADARRDTAPRSGNFLSQLPADRADSRVALFTVGISAVIFVALAPFAKVPLAPLPAFIPIYQSALILSDLVTAVLLLGQFRVLRLRGLLVLASGYLFTALITVAHTLSFPGLLAPGGWLGAGPQTTAWLYMFWHGVFPLLIIAYALLGDARSEAASTRSAIAGSVGAVAALVVALTLLGTVGRGLLPAIMTGNRYTTAMIFVVGGVWLLSLVALLVLWRQRRRTVLDVWLMVVMCAWLFDIALAAVLNAGRFDVGFYAGRIYGLLAATFVLMVLLLETSALAGTRVAAGEQRRDRRAPGVAYAAIGAFLLILVVIATQTYLAVREELTEVVTKRRLALAQIAAVTHSERLDRVADVAVSLATRVRFAELVALGEWDAAIRILQGVPHEFAFADRVAVFDAAGNIRADTGLERVSGRNFADRDWYRGLQRSGGKPYVSSMYRRAARPQIDVFAVAAPIVDREGRRTGILLLQVKTDAFFSWTRDLDFGDGGVLLVVDREGNEAFRSGAPKRDSVANLAANPVIAKLTQGRAGVETVRDGDVDNLYAFVPARHGWGVVVLQPAAAAFAEREQQLTRVLVGSGIILLFFLSSAGLAAHVAGERRRSERRYRERLRLLHGVDQAVVGGSPTEEIAAAVIQPLRELLDVPRLHVNVIDYESGDAQWLAAAGRRRTHAGPGVRFPLHMLGDLEALKRGEPQAIAAAALPASPQRDALLASGVRHYLVVPMVARGELIGALSIGSERASFPAAQTTVATEVATQLAIAIMQARLAERVSRKAERLRIVHEIDRAILSEVKPEAIAAAVVQPLRELLAVPRVVVNLFDLAAGEVEWLAAAGRHQMRSGPGVRYPLRFMGDVEGLKRGELQTIDTATLPEGADKQALLASGVHHYMAVPMVAGGELIGAVSFGGAQREFPPEQVAIVQEAATQIAVAIRQARLLERVRGHAAELEARVLERTAELEAVNKELGSFSYSVSHDLRAPLRAVDGYARMLEEDYAARLDEEGRRLLGVIRDSASRMGSLIDDLLAFSRLSRQPIARQTVDSAALLREIIAETRGASKASVDVGELLPAQADRALLKQVWVNLVSNAFKYSSKREAARIGIGCQVEGEENIYWVRDNGAGFDMRYAAKLFGVFQRLHAQDEFPGTGVGLAIVQRIVTRHGGRVWAEGKPGEGACFFFSLPRNGR